MISITVHVDKQSNARLHLTYHQLLERRDSLYKYSVGYSVQNEQMFYPNVTFRIHEVKDIHRTKVVPEESKTTTLIRKLNVKTS